MTGQRLGFLCAAILLGACGVSKEELADSAAARADARRDYAAKAALGNVSAYLAAKAEYTRAYELQTQSGKPMTVGSDSAMKELEARLKAIIGPVSIQGRDAPAKINLDGSPSGGYVGGSDLDGLRIIHGDTITIVVSTPELVANWLRFQGDTSRDPLVGLTKDHILTQAVSSSNAAVSHYADIRTTADTARGVFLAALYMRAQDYNSEPPDEVIVGVRRENRIFLVMAKARASIAPSPACRRIWESMVGPAVNDSVYNVYRDCYGLSAAKEAAFGTLVAQVRELVALLPER